MVQNCYNLYNYNGMINCVSAVIIIDITNKIISMNTKLIIVS